MASPPKDDDDDHFDVPPPPPPGLPLQTTSSTFKFKARDFVKHTESSRDARGSSIYNSAPNSPLVKHAKKKLDDSISAEEQEDIDFFETSYQTLHYLGKGRHSKVFCCKHRETGQIKAVKIWRKSRRHHPNLTAAPLVDFEDVQLEDDHLDAGNGFVQELKEFYVMQEMQYPNVCSIYELLEGPTHYYMVMEYPGGGTLKDDLDKQPGDRYPEDKAGFVMIILLRAVAYLHSDKSTKEDGSRVTAVGDSMDSLDSVLQKPPSGSSKTVLHCDLNLHNILLDVIPEKVAHLKLVDFGDSIPVDENIPFGSLSELDDGIDWYEPRGAQLEFMAPEMFAYDQTLSKASDLWSLGVICYIVLSGKYPFGAANMTSTCELQESIDNRIDNLFEQELVWNDVSDKAKDFITQLLQTDPEDRPTASDALNHVWMEHIRQRILDDKLAGGGASHRRHVVEHGQQVWRGLKATARRRQSQPKVLKQAALTLIASQYVLKEEKKYIDEIFQLMDVEADGVLSKAEVRRGYQEIFGKELQDSDLKALFAKVDIAGTGTIEYSEFVIAAMNEKQLLHTDKLRKAFQAFDTDHTGFISANNLQPLLQSYLMEQSSDESEHVAILEQIIAQADKDGDGQISWEEFVAMMLHSSGGRRRVRAMASNSKVAASATRSTNSLATAEIFSSTTTGGSSGKNVWESSVQLTFRPEHVIGRRTARLKDHYDIGEYIQSGAFGSVWFCTHKESGAERAVKYVKKSKSAKENELILREFNILRSLDHPNILKMFELFEDNIHYEIVMDACKGGDLCDEIDNFGAIAEKGASLILHQVLMCVNYCHQRHIVHCDLKPDNILLEANKAINQIKIIDFGLAANLNGEEELAEGSVVKGRIREKRGTLRFMAPEVLEGDYGPKCDVWAIGVMAFLLLSDKFPFDGKGRKEVQDKIQRGLYSFDSPIWTTISKDAKSFVSLCLTQEEEGRPSAEEALQHPWIKTAREAVSHHFHHSEVTSAAEALDNMKHFEARSVLAQASYTFIASQLLLKEEKARIDEVFRVMDVSCDGKLSKQEVKKGYLTVFGCELGDEEIDEMFDRVDIDGTGFIEYSEFVVASICQKDLFKSENLKKAFRMFDTHNRGYISKANLKRGISTFLGDDEAVNDDAIRKIMEEVDRDGDGRISYEEFLATMLNSADVPVSKPAKKGGLLHGFHGGIHGFLSMFDPNHHHSHDK